MAEPIRRKDDFWEYIVRLIDNNYDTVLDTDGCQIGDTVTFQSNAHPELSEQGYSKFQSQMELHRNFMTTFRNDIEWSALYAIEENVFMSIADDKDKSKSQGVYTMLKKEKELLDSFMYSINTGLLLNKGSIDVNGKSTIQERDTGRPVYIGEGLIPQIESGANKYCYNNKPTLSTFQLIMNDMADKSDSDTGNTILFMVNRKLWNDFQYTMGKFLADNKTDGNYLWSKAANNNQGGRVKVGATFNSYEYGGNTIVFAVDRTLTREYPDKGFGISIDLTADLKGRAPVEKYSITGGEFITNKIAGVGGLDGKTSGMVSSNVAGSKMVMLGYGAVVCYTPFKSAILREV